MRTGKKHGVGGADLTVDFKVFLGACTFTTGNVYEFLAQAAPLAVTGGQIYMDLVNPYYFPLMVTDQLRRYLRYRLRRMQMMYTCKLGANVATAFTCCYFPDPEYFESIGKADGKTLVTTTDLANSPGCLASPAWRDMVCPPIYDTRWCYTDGPGIAGTVHNFATNSASDRQAIPGVYGFVMQNSPTPGTAVTVGEIYMSMTIDLKGMKNLPNTAPALLQSREERKLGLIVKAVEQEIQKRKDSELKVQTDQQLRDEIAALMEEEKGDTDDVAFRNTMRKVVATMEPLEGAKILRAMIATLAAYIPDRPHDVSYLGVFEKKERSAS